MGLGGRHSVYLKEAICPAEQRYQVASCQQEDIAEGSKQHTEECHQAFERQPSQLNLLVRCSSTRLPDLTRDSQSGAMRDRACCS